jgi:hypothetical protein
MATLFDKLNQELETFGRRAQAAMDEGKLQIELMRVRRQRDNAARDLGLLTYRRERGTVVEDRRVEALMLKLDDLEAEITRLKRQLAAARGETVSVSDEPPPPAPTAAEPEPPPVW